MLERRREPLCSAHEGGAVHGDAAVTPLLSGHPVDAVVAVHVVSAEHAAFQVAAGLLANVGVSAIREGPGVLVDAGQVAPLQHDGEGTSPTGPPDPRLERHAVPHGDGHLIYHLVNLWLRHDPTADHGGAAVRLAPAKQ